MLHKLFKKEKRHEDVCAILDIGNGSVGGSLVSFAKGEKPRIVYSVRYPIHIPDKPTSRHLFEKMTKLLESVVKDLSESGMSHFDFHKHSAKGVKHVFCILSSPWYTSRTKIFRVERKQPVPLTDDFVQKVLEAEFQKSSIPEGARAMERKVIRARLNGYETKNPYGQAAKSIELGVYQSTSPSVVMDTVKKIVSGRFNAHHVVFHSFSLMTFSVIGDLYPNAPNYMFMDITGEVTEMSIVRRNLITDTLTLPHGRSLLMRKIAKKYKVSPDIAATYMKLVAAGNADKKLKTDVEKALKEAMKEWTDAFDEALKEASKSRQLPSKVFLTVDDDVAGTFTKAIEARGRYQLGVLEPFDATVLDKKILAHFCAFGRSGEEDPFLAIESLYFNKIFHM